MCRECDQPKPIRYPIGLDCYAEQDEHTDASCLECARAEREAGIVIGLGLAMAWGPLLQCTGFKRKEA
jgi:hypothetical protein